MKERLGGKLGALSFRRQAREADQQVDFSELVERARSEWLAARALFDNVSDPELIDHAIHLIVAAEKKYDYLLRRAKAEGVQLEPL